MKKVCTGQAIRSSPDCSSPPAGSQKGEVIIRIRFRSPKTAIYLYGLVAQVVEQRTENPRVGSANLSQATIDRSDCEAEGGMELFCLSKGESNKAA